MELFFKFYDDKPARLGIKYIYEFQAVKAYEDLVRLFGDSDLYALLELSRERIDLVLRSEFNGKQTVYKALEFKASDLQKLRQRAPGEPYEFVHIFAQHNTLLLAKPFRKAKFFRITTMELRGAEFVTED